MFTMQSSGPERNFKVKENGRPWEGPYVLFDPSLDRGYGHFMQEGGAVYGPYVISRFTKSDGATATIYWTMSTWQPYDVMLMKSTLRLSDWQRVDHLGKP